MSLNDLDTFQDTSRIFKVFQAYIRSFGVGSQLWGILHGAPCSPAGSLCRDHWRAAEKAKEEGERRERRERSWIFRLTAWQPAMTRVSVFQTQSLNAEFSPVMIVYSSRSKFMIHNENKPKELRKKRAFPVPVRSFGSTQLSTNMTPSGTAWTHFLQRLLLQGCGHVAQVWHWGD